LLGYLALMAVFVNDPSRRTLIRDILAPIYNGLATVALFYAAASSRNYGKKVRLAWTVLALGQGAFTLGDIAWVVMELGLQKMPFPSVADGFYLLYYPIFAAGIFLIPTVPLTRDETRKMLMDVGIVMISAVLVFWAFLIQPLIEANREDPLALAISFSYPVMDFIMFFALMQLLFLRPRSPEQKPIFLLMAGTATGIFIDSIYLIQSMQGIYSSGSILNFGWLLSYALIGLGAVSQADSSRHLSSGQSSLYRPFPQRFTTLTYIPYFSAGAAYVMLIWSHAHLTDFFMQFAAGIGAIIGLVFLRQVQVMDENAALLRAAQMDINERRHAEERLRHSERSYRLLAENVMDVIWTMDLNLRFTYFSPSIFAMTGYTAEEAMHLRLDDLLPPSSLETIMPILAEEMEKEKNPDRKPSQYITLEVEEYCKDGSTIWIEVKTSFQRDREGRAIGIQGVSRDITDRKRAQRALIKSEAKYRTIFENTGNAAVILEDDTTISLANSEAERIFGYNGRDVVGKKSWTEFIFPEDLELMKKNHALRRIDPEAAPRSYEFRLIDGLGRIRHIFMTIAMIPGTDQSVASLMDITERKIGEEKLKASLQEKELLLKEIHHRVKNNLQIVSSLLSLQSGYVKDRQTFDVFQESQNRVKSMALIHEKLYRSDDLAKIDFSEYIRSLCADLVRSYSSNSRGVRLDLDVQEVFLGLDAAISCGLIINELVSNSLKHAFSGDPGLSGSPGRIRIEFHRSDSGSFSLAVSDNGCGFPPGIDFLQTESLGLQLVRVLTEQLGGSIELDRTAGTKFLITFT